MGYEVKIRNSKSQKIELTLYDQVPVSLRDDIEVTVEKLSQAKHNIKTGELRWDLMIDGGKSVSKEFVYDVKYPKTEEVILE